MKPLSTFTKKLHCKWDKVFKNVQFQVKFLEDILLKIWKVMVSFKYFKGFPPQILLGPLLIDYFDSDIWVGSKHASVMPFWVPFFYFIVCRRSGMLSKWHRFWENLDYQERCKGFRWIPFPFYSFCCTHRRNDVSFNDVTFN